MKIKTYSFSIDTNRIDFYLINNCYAKMAAFLLLDRYVKNYSYETNKTKAATFFPI